MPSQFLTAPIALLAALTAASTRLPAAFATPDVIPEIMFFPIESQSYDRNFFPILETIPGIAAMIFGTACKIPASNFPISSIPACKI